MMFTGVRANAENEMSYSFACIQAVREIPWTPQGHPCDGFNHVGQESQHQGIQRSSCQNRLVYYVVHHTKSDLLGGKRTFSDVSSLPELSQTDE